MRHLFNFLACSFILNAAVASAQSHPDVVAQVKQELVERHVSLNGECGAFEITKRVAWRLRSEGAGVLSKPTGTNCQGFSTDTIVYPDGRIFDILIDSGGANAPSWRENGTVDASRYRPAFDSGDTPEPEPQPQPQPEPVPPIDLSPILGQLHVISEQLSEHAEAEEKHWQNARSLFKSLLPYLITIAGGLGGGLLAK